MNSVKQQQLERNQILNDLYDGKQPTRVFNGLDVDCTYALEYCGYDLLKDQYDINRLIEVCDKMSGLLDTDNMPVSIFRIPSIYRMLGAKTIILDKYGIAQHPNTEGMSPEEYGDFAKDPFSYIVNVLIPRLYSEFNRPEPDRTIGFAKIYHAYYKEAEKLNAGRAAVIDKYGKASVPMTVNISLAPMDFISDYLRSFTGISTDIRRYPERVLDAVDAITPLLYKKAIPFGLEPSKHHRTFFALHMPTFLREKDFAKFWWPSFLKLANAIDAAGYGMNIFCEDDWTRYLDYLQELPAGTDIKFEKGDPKLFKEKLGKKFILNGWYPASVLRSGTKQEVEDTCKELLDILAPGGGYYVTTTTSFMRLTETKFENLQTLCECIKTYGKY